MNMKTKEIGIIGLGRAGKLLNMIFNHEPMIFDKKKMKGFEFTELKNLVIKAKLIFISVSDDDISKVVRNILKLNVKVKGKLFYHLSGMNTTEILEPLKKAGAKTGALHPAMSIADPEWILKNTKKFAWTVQGEEDVRKFIRELLHKKNIKVFPISSKAKLPYHLGCVFASNLPVFNPEYAGIILRETNLPEKVVNKVAKGLLSCLQHNINQVGGKQAITGPLMRGDVTTISRHLEYLKDEPVIYDWYRNKCLTAAKRYGIKKVVTLLEK